MSFKTKILAAAIGVAAISSTAVMTAPAQAATPSCGNSCIDVFSRQFGTHHTPNYVMDVFRQGAKVGQPIILFRSSNSDPAQDFTFGFEGLVSDFYAAGLVSSTVNLHYGGGSAGSRDEYAFEVEYSPYGVESGLCVGVATTAIQGEGVTLQPCGVSSKTVWIVDDYDLGRTGFYNSYFPAINGSDTNFSHPYVLDYPHNGFPTDKPRPQLQVNRLTGFSNGYGPITGTIIDTQRWSANFGVIR